MLFSCWRDAAALTRTGTHLHNSLQSVQAAFRLSLWYSWSRITASLCEEGGERGILLFWEIYGKCKDWFLWHFKYSWIQLGIKPSVTSWCLCSPNCHLVLLFLPLNALCTIISENLGHKQICSCFCSLLLCLKIFVFCVVIVSAAFGYKTWNYLKLI